MIEYHYVSEKKGFRRFLSRKKIGKRNFNLINFNLVHGEFTGIFLNFV